MNCGNKVYFNFLQILYLQVKTQFRNYDDNGDGRLNRNPYISIYFMPVLILRQSTNRALFVSNVRPQRETGGGGGSRGIASNFSPHFCAQCKHLNFICRVLARKFALLKIANIAY